jgi:hypothetical protein
MKVKKEQYPIPDFCKVDCYFRNKKAKYMPACEYACQVDIKEVNGQRVCKTYHI